MHLTQPVDPQGLCQNTLQNTRVPLETYMAKGDLQVTAIVKSYRQTFALHITSYENDPNSEYY